MLRDIFKSHYQEASILLSKIYKGSYNFSVKIIIKSHFGSKNFSMPSKPLVYLDKDPSFQAALFLHPYIISCPSYLAKGEIAKI